MKRKLLIVLFIVSSSFIIIDGINNSAFTYSNNPPAGCSGAPGDYTCAVCHGGSNVTAKTGWITSDIDTTIGYVPGKKYTITASIVNTSSNVSGFEIVALNSSNANMGTATLISPAYTSSTIGSGGRNYVIQTFSGTSQKKWSFNWTAPAAGKGKVTIYGTFNAANGDGSSGGDIIYTSKMSIKEGTATTIASLDINNTDVSLYPNPTSDYVNLSYQLNKDANVTIDLCDILGQKIKTLLVENKSAGEQTDLLDVNAVAKGAYFLQIHVNKSIVVKKIQII
jgi:hypothetical protein